MKIGLIACAVTIVILAGLVGYMIGGIQFLHDQREYYRLESEGLQLENEELNRQCDSWKSSYQSLEQEYEIFQHDVEDTLTQHPSRPHQPGEFWQIHQGKVMKFIDNIDPPTSDIVIFSDGYVVEGYEVFTNSRQLYSIPNKEELRDYFQIMDIGRSVAIMIQTYPEN